MDIANLSLTGLNFDSTCNTSIVISDGSVGTTGIVMTNGPFSVDAAAASQTISANISVTNVVAIALAGNKTLTLSGVISGAGSLSVSGAGKAILTNADTFAGSTAIAANSIVQLGDGTANGSVIGNIINNGSLSVINPGAVNLIGIISGTGSLAKSAAGVLTLSNVNTYGGTTNISGGTVRLNANFPLPLGLTAPNIWFDAADTASLTLAGNTVTAWANKGSVGGNVTVNNNAPTYLSSNSSFAGRPTINFNAGANQRLAGFDATFLNNTPYTIFAIEGKAAAGNYYFLGTNHSAPNQGLHFGYRTDTDFAFAQYANDLDYTNAPTYNGTTEVAREWTGKLDFSTGHFLYFNGTQVQQGTNGVNTDGFNGLGAGDGIVGAGFAFNNNYQGDLGEILIFNSALSDTQRQSVDVYLQKKWGIIAGALPSSLPATTAVTISNGGILDINGLTQTVASLTSTDNLNSGLVLGAGKLTVGDANNTTFDGIISGTGGNLTKVGAGTLTLTKANTHSGTTTISAGAIQINNNNSLQNTTVTVNANAGVFSAPQRMPFPSARWPAPLVSRSQTERPRFRWPLDRTTPTHSSRARCPARAPSRKPVREQCNSAAIALTPVRRQSMVERSP